MALAFITFRVLLSPVQCSCRVGGGGRAGRDRPMLCWEGEVDVCHKGSVARMQLLCLMCSTNETPTCTNCSCAPPPFRLTPPSVRIGVHHPPW